MSLAAMYNKTGTVRRYEYTTSVLGTQQGESLTTNATGVACTLQPLTAGEINAYSKMQAEVTHRLFCPSGTDILPKDEFVISSTTYEVQGVMDDGGRGHHKKCILRERVES